MDDKIKFLEKDVEYWEIQNEYWPTERTKEALSWARHHLNEYREEMEDKLNNRPKKQKGKLLRFKQIDTKDEA